MTSSWVIGGPASWTWSGGGARRPPGERGMHLASRGECWDLKILCNRESHLCILINSDVCGKKLQTPIISNCNISGHHLFICISGCWCWGQAARRLGGKELKNSANVLGAAKRPVYLVLAFTNVWVIMSEKWYIDQICCASNLQSCCCCCCCCCCCNCCWILNAICKRKQHRGLLQI